MRIKTIKKIRCSRCGVKKPISKMCLIPYNWNVCLNCNKKLNKEV